MTKQKGTMKAVTMVMFIMVLSRLLGFFREVIMTNTFGRGMETDAFFAAFTIPDMMYYLLIGGALSAAFIPVFTSYLATEGEKEAWEVASTFINLIVISLVILSVLGIIFANYLVPLVAYNFKGEQLALTVKLTRFMFPAVTFTALAGLTSGVLQSYKHFNVSYIGPILYNVGIILGTLFLGKYYGILGMALGVIAGAIANFLFQFFFMTDKMKYYRPSLNFKHEGVKKIFKLMIPSLIGLSVNQINLVVNQNIASGLDVGSITALRIANRLILLPLGIFAVSISSVIFPTLTSQIARGELDRFKETFSFGVRNIFFIIIPSSIGLLILRLPVIRLLFVHGAFNEQDAMITAHVLFFYTFGLIAQGGIQVIIRGFYANHDTKTPLKISIMAVFTNVLLNLIFIRYTSLGVGGLALAYSIGSFINMILLFYTFSKTMGGIREREIFVSITKTTLASIIMGVIIMLINNGLSPYLNLLDKKVQLFQVGAGAVIGGGIFLFLSHMMKMEETKSFLKMVLRK